MADTTVLSNFGKQGRLDLVLQAFPGLCIPEAVLFEVQEGEKLGHLPPLDWSALTQVQLTASQLLEAEELGRRLGPGEAQCLAWARSAGAFLLTDDMEARLEAENRGISLSGTLGVFIRLLRSGRLPLPEADDLLRRMISAGYRSPIRSLVEHQE